VLRALILGPAPPYVNARVGARRKAQLGTVTNDNNDNSEARSRARASLKQLLKPIHKAAESDPATSL